MEICTFINTKSKFFCTNNVQRHTEYSKCSIYLLNNFLPTLSLNFRWCQWNFKASHAHGILVKKKKKFDEHSNRHRFQWTKILVCFIHEYRMNGHVVQARQIHVNHVAFKQQRTSSGNAESSLQKNRKKKKNTFLILLLRLSNDSSCKRDSVSATRRLCGLFRCWNSIDDRVGKQRWNIMLAVVCS